MVRSPGSMGDAQRNGTAFRCGAFVAARGRRPSINVGNRPLTFLTLYNASSFSGDGVTIVTSRTRFRLIATCGVTATLVGGQPPFSTLAPLAKAARHDMKTDHQA